MYNFVDINEPAQNNENRLKTEINGINIDDKYQGKVRTLNVSGRGLIAPTNQLTNKVGADGAWLDSSTYPHRTIEVEILINAELDEVRDILEALNADLLSAETSLLALSFTDDYEWLYYAKLNEISAPKEDNSSFICSLIFICPDPFKYKKKETITDGKINPYLRHETKPEKIIVTATGPAAGIFVVNETRWQVIKIQEVIQTGEKVTFDFTTNLHQKGIDIKKGNTSILTSLDITSEFENFTIKGGDQITVSPSEFDIEIHYKERAL